VTHTSTIAFDVEIGNKRRHVEISQPFGAGDVWYIIIDNYLHGQLYKRQGRWQGDIRNSDLLVVEDIGIIGAIIDEEQPKP